MMKDERMFLHSQGLKRSRCATAKRNMAKHDKDKRVNKNNRRSRRLKISILKGLKFLVRAFQKGKIGSQSGLNCESFYSFSLLFSNNTRPILFLRSVHKLATEINLLRIAPR